MILVLDAVVLAIGAALLTRGSVSALAHLRLRGEAVLVIGLVLQVVLPRFVRGGLLIDSTAVWILWGVPSALVFVTLLLNSRFMGASFAAAGVGLNMLVVFLNSGMPVSLAAGAIAGFDIAAMTNQIGISWLHVPVQGFTRLVVLSDVLPILGPTWHRGMASLGDILMAAGVAHLVFCQMHLADNH